MLCLDLAVGFLLVLGLLQGDDLAFGEDQTVLCDLCLQGLEAELEGLQVMAKPDAPNAARGDEHILLAEFVGDADLAEGWLFQGRLNDGLLDGGVYSVLDDGLAFGYLPQGFLTAGVVKFLEAVEAVSAVAQNLAGLGDVAQLLGQFQQAHLGLDDLLIGRHV